MTDSNKRKGNHKELRVGITGASGSLGKAFSKHFRSKGCFVIGFTHRAISNKNITKEDPNKWFQWSNGKEKELETLLGSLDILILNHGINPGANLENTSINKALEINALSHWRFIELFENITFNKQNINLPKEIWINTSEAEIQPAFSPSYEISKRLLGQLITYKKASLTKKETEKLKIRKLILGPFKSDLNPIGIMNANFVVNQIMMQSRLGLSLIIVTPNPLTYLFMPLAEFIRELYFKLLKNNFKS